ncbi:MAG: NrdH-redoxin [Anaerolineae bacterium]|nr:NrdH-redoxin [Anaerolineae bacterium]
MPRTTEDSKKKQPRVIMFTTPTCTYCNAAKHYLRQHRVKFREVDVSRDQAAARDMMRRAGSMGVPVLDIGGHIVRGFDRDKINQLLDLTSH